MDKAFQQGITIIKQLENNGHEAYFVGGSVRDTLMKRNIGDIDIATSATPKEIQEIFPKTIDVGAEHGTIVVMLDEHDSFEVTTFRTDGEYTDKRRPDQVTFVKNLEEDLKRRDFTMNAIAMTKTGRIIDPFGGQEDIRRKVIRTVGKASDRFQEDALRMLRAIRFISQLSFSLEVDTFLAIKQDCALIEHVSVERKTLEMDKLLEGQGYHYGMNLLVASGLYQYLPGLRMKQDQLLELADKDRYASSRSAKWTILCAGLEILDVEEFLQEWKLPKKIIKTVSENILYIKLVQEEGWTKELLYRAGLDQALEVHLVLVKLGLDEACSKEEILEMIQSLPIKSQQDIVINGNDVLQLAEKRRGKWMSQLVQDMERALLYQEVLNERAALKEWVKEWLQKYEQNC
ncbi:CCA-adding enzyme [Bacillus sp. THAF10]|uniref:CCA tRNA nucleotidyltransferase n=1 Tax=Bacillus sp. THAF10 TaxID=2587848 RepID=UPI001268BAB4|nr:CCA tRNA nucleotidyltransferase [Bacillus sp. THAF10]QFT89374.1 CCA-adding enzyme [Bacillus sp. THAF10]